MAIYSNCSPPQNFDSYIRQASAPEVGWSSGALEDVVMASSSVGSDATMHSCPPWDLIWEHRLDMYMSLPCYSVATAGWFARTRSARSCSTRALARCALPTF